MNQQNFLEPNCQGLNENEKFHCQLKKQSQPKSWVTLYLLGTFRTSNLEDSISSDPERTAPRKRGKKTGFIETWNEGLAVWTRKVILWIKENWIS